MTAAQVQEWMLPAALVVAIMAGLLIILVSLRTSWKKTSIALTTITYALLGALLILSPKWHKMTAKYDGTSGSVVVSSLQNQLSQSLKENASLRTQIDLVRQLDNKEGRTAADWLSSAKQIKNDVDWANFLPADNKTFKVEVPIDDMATITSLAIKLGKQPAEVGLAFKDSGLIFLKDYDPAKSTDALAKDLWLNPVAK